MPKLHAAMSALQQLVHEVTRAPDEGLHAVVHAVAGHLDGELAEIPAVRPIVPGVVVNRDAVPRRLEVVDVAGSGSTR
jgi:hypothetical protein